MIDPSARATIAVMSNLETLAPTPNSATAEIQVPLSDGQPKVAEPPKSRKKCLVLSLIRHGQVRYLLFLILNIIFNA